MMINIICMCQLRDCHTIAKLYIYSITGVSINIPGSYNVLCKFCEDLKNNQKLKEVCKLAVNYGVEKALGFLQITKRHLVETCQENKDLMKPLTKNATKGTIRYFAFGLGTPYLTAVTGFKYGVRKVGSQAVKRALNVANPAGIVCDLAQAGFEYAGYEKRGKAIGMWGNIGISAFAGFAVGGPLGAAVGPLTGFGTWVFGESVGRAIDESIG